MPSAVGKSYCAAHSALNSNETSRECAGVLIPFCIPCVWYGAEIASALLHNKPACRCRKYQRAAGCRVPQLWRTAAPLLFHWAFSVRTLGSQSMARSPCHAGSAGPTTAAPPRPQQLAASIGLPRSAHRLLTAVRHLPQQCCSQWWPSSGSRF
jgi:hypothetical protein